MEPEMRISRQQPINLIIIAGKIIDYDYRKTAAKVGIAIDRAKGDDLDRFPIERARLRSIWYFIAISTTCTIGYGWTLHTRTVSVTQ